MKPVGRPRASPDKELSQRIIIRVTKKDFEFIQECAGCPGLTISEYCRQRLIDDVWAEIDAIDVD